MPVVTFAIPEGLLTAEGEVRLLERASSIYAQALASPIDRIRAFLNVYPASRYASGGQAGGAPAPYFEFIVMEGRPLEQRQALMRAFSELLAEETGVPIAQVRGMCRRVLPEEWCIGGHPASDVRKAHVAALGRDSGRG